MLLLRSVRACLASAIPVFSVDGSDEPSLLRRASDDHVSRWYYAGVATGLVLLGGLFAGLTIALMSLDETYLKVAASSGDQHEKKYAARVLWLLNKGKHWVLVTLLLCNVITNETLPIVLHKSFGGGGLVAIVGSTVMIGECDLDCSVVAMLI